MKNKLIMLALMGTMFSFSACEKDMDTYDFSNSVAPYIEIKANEKPITVIEGKTATITVQMREVFQEPITVQYEVKGAFTSTGTITIPRNTLSVDVPISIPASMLAAADDSKQATFVLKSAKKGDTDLTIGLKGADGEVMTINIVPNLVSIASTEATIQETSSVYSIPVKFSAALGADATINYTLTSADGNAANSLELMTDNPLVVKSGAIGATIQVKVKNNMVVNPDNVYNLVINSVTTASGIDVFLNSDKASFKLTVDDDTREINFVSETPVTIAAQGNKNFEVMIDQTSTEIITINYTVTGGVEGVDYTDVTGGSVTLYPGASVANINLKLLEAAFGTNQKLKVTINSIESDDKEVLLGENKAIELVLN